MGLKEAIEKLFGKEAEEELGIAISSSDGCVGEKILEKLRKVFKPC